MKGRYLLLALGLGVAAGCATTPEGVLKDGTPHEFKSALTPYAASICIARNAKALGGGIVGQERLLGESSTEVVVRRSNDTLAVAQIHRDGVFSKVSVSVARAAGSDAKTFANKLMSGC